MNHKLLLTQHCIETEIKKRYNKDIFDYIKSGADPAGDLEARIEIFQEALETFDFGFLRNQYPDLRGNSDAAVTLYRDDAGRLHITIDEKDIEP